MLLKIISFFVMLWLAFRMARGVLRAISGYLAPPGPDGRQGGRQEREPRKRREAREDAEDATYVDV